MTFLPDPCPLPSNLKKRTLIEKEKTIYAPMSGVGGIVYDKDAVYIDLGGSHHHSRQQHKKEDFEEPSNDLVGAMIGTEKTLDEKIEESEIQLFSGSAPIKSGEFRDDHVQDQGGLLGSVSVQGSDGRTRRKAVFGSDQDEEEDVEGGSDDNEDDFESDSNDEDLESEEEDSEGEDDSDKSRIRSTLDSLGKKKKKQHKGNGSSAGDSGNVSFDNDSADSNDEDSDNEDSDSEDSDNEHTEVVQDDKADIVRQASESYYDRLSNTTSLRKLVYGQEDTETKEDSEDKSDDDEEAIGGLFKVLKRDQESKSTHAALMNQEDSTKFKTDHVQDWTVDSICDSIRDCFVTGKWKQSEDAEALLRLDDDHEDEDDEVYGDFEDLETGEVHNATTKEEMEAEDKPRIVEDEQEVKKKRLEQKKLLKKRFDEDYDEDGNGKTHYDELKKEVEAQTMVSSRNHLKKTSNNPFFFGLYSWLVF